MNLVINGVKVRSKSTINVLGVLIDSKMNWQSQAAQAISKLKKSLHGIKLIKKYLNGLATLLEVEGAG